MSPRSIGARVTDAWRAFRGGSADSLAAAPARLASGAPRLKVRSSWKGAEFSRLNTDWLATLISPHQELQGDLRTLRARAREMARNNGYAGGFLEHTATNVLGPHGMRLKAQVRDARGELNTQLNEYLEARWNDWFTGPVSADGEMSGIELEELALQTVGREGETFPRRVVGPDFPHALALQLIDPDLVDDSYNLQGVGAEVEVYMGVEVDRIGRRLGYHVLDYPYGPGQRGRGRTRISARDMFHVYRSQRANQMRGITWLARAMTTLKDQERYSQNELVASAAGAAKMGFITNAGDTVHALQEDPVTEGEASAGGTSVASGSDSTGGSRVTLEAEPGSIWELDPGQKFEGWSPDHPNAAFGDFDRAILQKAAAALGISYEELSADFSQVTYLSARASLLVRRMVYARLQQWWIRTFRKRLYDWWLEIASLSGELELPGDWRQYRSALWIPRGWDWVDPGKDALAAKLMLELNLTTYTRLTAARGDDFEEILEERERERKLAAEHGIDLDRMLAGAGSGAAAAPAPAEPARSSGGGTDEDDDAGEGDDEEEAPARPSRNGKRGASRDLVRR